MGWGALSWKLTASNDVNQAALEVAILTAKHRQSLCSNNLHIEASDTAWKLTKLGEEDIT